MANIYTDAVHKAILPGNDKSRGLVKAVLTAMAWHTNNDTGVFWGSHNKFAAEANVSRDTVVRAVPKLVELGLLEITGERPTRFGPCNEYRMNLEVVLALSDQGPVAPSADSTQCEERSDQVPVAADQWLEAGHQVPVATENSSLNSSENSSEKNSAETAHHSVDSVDREEQEPNQTSLDADEALVRWWAAHVSTFWRDKTITTANYPKVAAQCAK